MLLKIGGEGTVISAAQVGVFRPTEGFVKVYMGVHQARQHQMLRRGIKTQRCRRQQASIPPTELHRRQPLRRDRNGLRSEGKLQQAARNPGLEGGTVWGC